MKNYRDYSILPKKRKFTVKNETPDHVEIRMSDPVGHANEYEIAMRTSEVFQQTGMNDIQPVIPDRVIREINSKAAEDDVLMKDVAIYEHQSSSGDPAPGESFEYYDSNGDKWAKINVGGTVKTTQLIDYSTL